MHFLSITYFSIFDFVKLCKHNEKSRNIVHNFADFACEKMFFLSISKNPALLHGIAILDVNMWKHFANFSQDLEDTLTNG